jgi:hypothetical protein
MHAIAELNDHWALGAGLEGATAGEALADLRYK